MSWCRSMVKGHHRHQTNHITVLSIALSAAITCATVALSETGIEMLDLPIACTVVCHRDYITILATYTLLSLLKKSEHSSGLLIDPALEEEYNGDEVVLLKSEKL